jgi:eukaryotic-like serine/threonine-protein kinase
MTPAQWERLKELFEAALDYPVEERRKFGERVAQTDPELREELEALLRNHEAAEAFLEQPDEADRYLLAAGELLRGRFRIVRSIGRGGMGEVYEAMDEDLGEPVALKILLREFAGDKDSVARLVREIQMARKVTHRNVCRVFDLDRDSHDGADLVFLTMELLLGETLSAKLETGPLSADEALKIARQVAAALDAAHAAGVIHRDLKSANVILTADGGGSRAVITDFGLARSTNSVSDRAALTRSGLVMGTPAFMAPELLEGGEATPASDLYAFGVLLHQMRTGSTHFPAKQLEPAWDKAIRSCLERSAAARPGSAGEAIRAIEGRNNPLSLRRYAVPIFLAALVALLWLGMRLFNQSPPSAASTVMLTDFQNTTGDTEINAVTEVFRNQLRQSARFRLWDPARLPQVLDRMALSHTVSLSGETAREIALREGVPWIIVGSVGPLGSELVLNLRLEETSPKGVWVRRSWDYSIPARGKSSLQDAVHEGALWVRRKMGEGLPEIAARDQAPQDTTSASWQALASYAAAERSQRNNESERAIALLKEATHYDPQFALARMRLGDLLIANHRQKEGLEAYQGVLAQSRERRLTRREELRIRGLYASDTWDYVLAETSFAEMEAEYPDDYLASFYLADTLRWQGRLEEALKHSLAAVRKQPDSIPAEANLARTLLMLGHFQELDAAIEKIRALGANGIADHYAAMERFAAADYPRSLKYSEQEANSSSSSDRSRGYSTRAFILAELGRAAEARKDLTEGARLDEQAGLSENRASKLDGVAYLLLREKDRAGARAYALSAAAADPSPLATMRACTVLAEAGFPNDASRLYQEVMKTLPPSRLANTIKGRIAGEIALARGDASGAVQAFSAAAANAERVGPPDYLARALIETPSRAEALPLLQIFPDKPELLWHTIEYDFPGSLTDNIMRYARLAVEEGQYKFAKKALDIYLSRRSGSSDPELGLAKELSTKLTQ